MELIIYCRPRQAILSSLIDTLILIKLPSARHYNQENPTILSPYGMHEQETLSWDLVCVFLGHLSVIDRNFLGPFGHNDRKKLEFLKKCCRRRLHSCRMQGRDLFFGDHCMRPRNLT